MQGHNAVMLVDKNGIGLIFSLFSSGGNPLNTSAEMRFSVLNKEKADELIKNNGNPTWIFDMVATDGVIQHEKYDGLYKFDITNESGYKMFEFAVNRYNSPGDYKLIGDNCDDFAVNCLLSGGADIIKYIIPNDTFDFADFTKRLIEFEKQKNK